MSVLGIFLVVVGVFGVLWSGRAAFYRRNNAGVQEFSSYKTSIILPFVEKTIRLVSILVVIAGVGILFGIGV